MRDKKENTEYKVTFIELGSTRCIPCQQMQPVMKSVEEKYGKPDILFPECLQQDPGDPSPSDKSN